MIDYYLQNNQPNALSAQTAIRNGDFGNQDGSDCIQGSEMFSRVPDRVAAFLDLVMIVAMDQPANF